MFVARIYGAKGETTMRNYSEWEANYAHTGQPNQNGDIFNWTNHDFTELVPVTISETSNNIILDDSTFISTIGVGGTGIPNVNYPVSVPTITFTSVSDKYRILELPRDDSCPIAVYVCGRMVTLGILGTDVECAFTGDKLVFEPGIIQSILMSGRITVSVEYKDKIYHYNVSTNLVDNSSTLLATLVSTIEK